jgi:basic amino acid/polyamine antiporter, APA family
VGFTVYFIGSNQLMLILLVVGGVLALCGALTLCELSAAMPRTGGDYVFLYQAYGPLAAFLSGWVSFLIGFAGPIAASASAAAKYLLALMRLDDASAAVAQPAVASVAIVALGVIHCQGRGSTIRAQAGMTALKIAILVTLAVAGLVAGWGRWENLADPPPLSSGLLVTSISLLSIAVGVPVYYARTSAARRRYTAQ